MWTPGHENRASQSRAGARGSRVPGPGAAGAERGRSRPRHRPSVVQRSLWIFVPGNFEVYVGLRTGRLWAIRMPLSWGCASPGWAEAGSGGPWELPKSWASRAKETGSREQLSLIRPQAERDSNQGSRETSFLFFFGNFIPNEANSVGFISLCHSVQRRLIRHLLCARLERAWHCQSAQFRMGGPRTGARGSKCRTEGRGPCGGGVTSARGQGHESQRQQAPLEDSRNGHRTPAVFLPKPTTHTSLTTRHPVKGHSTKT